MGKKNIWRRAVVWTLALSLMFSNVSVASYSKMGKAAPEPEPYVQQNEGQEGTQDNAALSKAASADSDNTVSEPPADTAAPSGTAPSLEEPKEPEGPAVPETPEEPSEPEAPAESQEPSEPKAPAESQEPSEQEKPAEQESPEEPELPAAPEAPAEQENPETPPVQEEPALEEPEVPIEEIPEEEELPVEPEGSLENREELAGASMDVASAAMWPAALYMAAPFSVENDPMLISDEEASQWKFNIYYVNEDDPRQVTKTEDFSLKYQMEFRALSTIEKGQIQIKIPRALLRDREENPVNPADIGVPMVEASSLKEAVEKGKESRNTSFNYYISGDDLVFFNYKDISQGTNAAWQVLYRNVKLMPIRDLTDWSLQAEITVGGVKAEMQPAPLKGTVDSHFELTRVSKKPYENTNLSHTPELYTKDQVKKYVDLVNGALPTEYLKDVPVYEETGDEREAVFEDFVYAVWEIDANVEGNQPVDLYITERPQLYDATYPSGNGYVVGFKNKNSGVKVRVEKTENESGENEFRIIPVSQEDLEKWSVGLYVVTAYLKSDMERIPQESLRLGNEVTAEAVGRDHNAPEDPDRESQSKKVSATFKYEVYDWKYDGDVLAISKDQDQVSSAWLKLYEIAEDGYGKLSFATRSSFRGFDLTHPKDAVSSDRGYQEGTAYELVTADDLLYASLETPADLKDEDGNQIPNRILLGKDDYYYSKVTVKQTDTGYDIWEDKETGAQNEGEGIDRTLYIWAMFGDSAEETWEPAGEVKWNSSGTAEYIFTPEQIARQPYRVAVKHKATDYRTDCRIEKEIFIKNGSQISRMIKACNDKEQNPLAGEQELKIKLEEVSGIWGIFYDKDGQKAVSSYSEASGETSGKTSGEDGTRLAKTGYGLNYNSIERLKEDTLAIYRGHGNAENLLPYRRLQKNELTGLVGKAEAFKNSVSTNDPERQRILVDYSLTAYDGYQVYSGEAVNALKSTEAGRLLSPGRSQVVFYDLLPYGMQFDRSYQVTAGRITNLANENYKTTSALWNTGQVSLTADDIRITRDWRGTGRTMVEFHLTYSGADAAEYSLTRSGGLWAEGWGVAFRAYYDWSSQDVVQTEANVCAFMPEAPAETDPDKLSEKEKRPLCGAKNILACDNGQLPEFISRQTAYKALLTSDPKTPDGGIDGNPYNHGIANVLFAQNTADPGGYAGSNETKITKRIYAQEDQNLAEESATVVPGENYLYEITVDVSAGTLEDLVIFDRLENAAEDLKGGGYSFSDKRWQGTFRSVITTGMEKIGIRPEVYYRIGDPGQGEMKTLEDLYKNGEDADAVRGWLETESGKFTASVTAENPAGTGWVSREAYEAMEGHELSEVRALAVVLRDNGQEDESYVLGTEEHAKSVSFRIQMQAPTVEELSRQTGISVEELNVTEYYAYNNPCYFALYTPVSGGNTEKMAAVSGAPVKANLAPCQSLEVIKSLSRDVPASVSSTSFRFRLYWEDKDEKGNEVKRGAAGKEYKLYKKSIQADGSVRWVEQKNRLYETDGSGYFSLRADEKAEFVKNLPDAEHIRLEEQASLFWKPEIPEEPRSIEGQEDAYRYSVTNTYRTVLFVEKKLAGVPKSAEAEVKDHQFEFQIQVKKKGSQNWETLSLTTPMYYMDRASEYGTVLEQSAVNIGGRFSMRADQTAAIFMDNDVTDYRLKEIGVWEQGSLLLFDSEDDLEDISWICGESTGEEKNVKTGSVQMGTNRASVTNYYRYKDLYLTKTLENQAEGYQEAFTFQVFKIVKDDKETETEVPVTGGYVWELLNLDGTPAKDTDGKPIAGTLGEDGRFTAFCGGRMVRIKGLPLEAGRTDTTYVIRETLKEDSRYEAIRDTAEVTLHSMNAEAKGEIVNRYLYYNLSVSKMLLPSMEGNSQAKSEETDRKFVMKAEVEGVLLSSHPYILKGSDGLEITPTAADYAAETEELRKEAEPNNEITEDEILAKRNIQALEDGTYAYRTNGEGEFRLKSGQTAVLKDAGKRDQIYGVYEKKDADYPQLIMGENTPDADPFGPATRGTFAFGAEAGVTIINGGSGDYLILSKEYVGIDAEGKAAVAAVPEVIKRNAQNSGRNNPLASGFLWNEGWEDFNNPEGYFADWNTWISLEVTDEKGQTYLWPGEEGNCSFISIFNGKELEEGWQWHYWNDGCNKPGYFMLPFGSMVLINKQELKEAGIKSYTLNEIAPDRYKVGWLAMKDENQKNVIRWVEVKQRESDVYSRSLDENSVAVLHNEVSGIPMEGSRIGKSMMAGSDPVAQGAKLVWRLEQYQEGQWVSAPGVKYISGYYNTVDVMPEIGIIGRLTGGVRETDAQGRIVLEKGEGSNFPAVQFLEADVYLNLYDEKDPRITGSLEGVYRLVEAFEDDEFDSAWGRLAGYSKDGTEGLSYKPASNTGEMIAPNISQGAALIYMKGAWYQKLNFFCNSSGNVCVDVEKQMEDSSGEGFTMILKQLVSDDRSVPGVPGRDIAYRLYYTDGIPVDEEEHLTTAEGTFTLRPGQYARLELPHDTNWTVEETVGSGYKMPVLKGTGKNLSLADDGSRMYIHTEAVPVEEIDWGASAWGLLAIDNFYVTQEQLSNLKFEELQIGVPMSDGTIWLDGEEYEVRVGDTGIGPSEVKEYTQTWEEWKSEAVVGSSSKVYILRKNEAMESPYSITILSSSDSKDIFEYPARKAVTRKLNADDINTEIHVRKERDDEGAYKPGNVINIVQDDSFGVVMYVCLRWVNEDENGTEVETIINGIEETAFSNFKGKDITIYLVGSAQGMECHKNAFLHDIDTGAFAGCRSVEIYAGEPWKGYVDCYNRKYKDTLWTEVEKVEFLVDTNAKNNESMWNRLYASLRGGR